MWPTFLFGNFSMFIFQFKNGIDTDKLYTLYNYCTTQNYGGEDFGESQEPTKWWENVANRFTIVIITIGAKAFL